MSVKKWYHLKREEKYVLFDTHKDFFSMGLFVSAIQMAYHHPYGSISICFNQPRQFSDASTAVFPSIKFDRWKDGQRTIWKLNNCKTISDGHLFYLFRLFGWPVSISQSRSMEVLWKTIINQGTTLSLAFWSWRRSRLPSLFTLLFGDTRAMRSLWFVEVTRCPSYLSS